MEDQLLKRVGRYDVLEVVGRGGAAIVYLAHQRDLERRVALKELAPHHTDSDFAARFIDESRMAASMSHPNVVTVHEYFVSDGVPYIAMEYLPYGSLRQYVGQLSTAQVAGVLEGVLAGLSHGQTLGIVHRDLKPENLLVSGDGRVKIADFGVARAFNRATRQVVTVAGTTIGTPAYMSPEQALGGELTTATDLYSLGVVTWELLAGQLPFDDNDTPVAVLYRHVHEPVPSVRTVAPDVDPDIAGWLDKLLAKRSKDRFQTADEAWEALEDVVLELLGPRWRRAARLAVDGAVPREPRTLTPAAFSERPALETQTDPPDEPVHTTIAPSRPPRRSHTTMLRIARRRPGGDEVPESSAAAARRRLAAAAILLVMVAAAVVGVVLAQPGSSSQTTSTSNAAAQARAAANKQLSSIATALATTSNKGITALRSATTPSGQATAATTLAKDYTGAAARVARLSGATSMAAPLHTTLTKTATAYTRLAAAAKAVNKSRYDAARSAIKTDEQQLQSEVAKL